MTDPREDAVSRRYRELAPEESPRALDEAILAASRRAVGAGPQLSPWAPAGRKRWYVPLAAAAVIVLSIGLTLRVQLEQPAPENVANVNVAPPSPNALQVPQPPRQAAKAAVAEDKPQAAPPAGDQIKLRARTAPAPAPERREEPAARSRPPAELPQPFKPEAPAREAAAAAAPRADSRSLESPAMMRAPAAGGALARKSMQEADVNATPEKALERIAELRKAGRHDEADKALAEFRKRYPDYKLSDEMKAKVERRLAR